MLSVQVLSLIVSLGLMALVVWWFFAGSASEGASSSDGTAQRATVVIDGGYNPEVTHLVAGKPTQLTFIRKDKSSCLEEVIIPDFGVQKKLAVGESYTIELPEMSSGEYDYSCGMRMYHGKLKVSS